MLHHWLSLEGLLLKIREGCVAARSCGCMWMDRCSLCTLCTESWVSYGRPGQDFKDTLWLAIEQCAAYCWNPSLKHWEWYVAMSLGYFLYIALAYSLKYIVAKHLPIC